MLQNIREWQSYSHIARPSHSPVERVRSLANQVKPLGGVIRKATYPLLCISPRSSSIPHFTSESEGTRTRALREKAGHDNALGRVPLLYELSALCAIDLDDLCMRSYTLVSITPAH